VPLNALLSGVAVAKMPTGHGVGGEISWKAPVCGSIVPVMLPLPTETDSVDPLCTMVHDWVGSVWY
jgi:hypothetical protein